MKISILVIVAVVAVVIDSAPSDMRSREKLDENKVSHKVMKETLQDSMLEFEQADPANGIWDIAKISNEKGAAVMEKLKETTKIDGSSNSFFSVRSVNSINSRTAMFAMRAIESLNSGLTKNAVNALAAKNTENALMAAGATNANFSLLAKIAEYAEYAKECKDGCQLVSKETCITHMEVLIEEEERKVLSFFGKAFEKELKRAEKEMKEEKKASDNGADQNNRKRESTAGPFMNKKLLRTLNSIRSRVALISINTKKATHAGMSKHAQHALVSENAKNAMFSHSSMFAEKAGLAEQSKYTKYAATATKYACKILTKEKEKAVKAKMGLGEENDEDYEDDVDYKEDEKYEDDEEYEDEEEDENDEKYDDDDEYENNGEYENEIKLDNNKGMDD